MAAPAPAALAALQLRCSSCSCAACASFHSRVMMLLRRLPAARGQGKTARGRLVQDAAVCSSKAGSLQGTAGW